MKLSKNLIDKLIAASSNVGNSGNPEIIAKIKNVSGPGVFYAMHGSLGESNKFYMVGLTNIDFRFNEIMDEPVIVHAYFEDFDNFKIPFGHVNFEVDTKWKGNIKDAESEFNLD